MVTLADTPAPVTSFCALAAPVLRSVTFPTNLKSFVSLGKAHKLHNAIDHWLAGVARQAHIALDFITGGERAVDKGLRGRGRESEEGGGGAKAPSVGRLTQEAGESRVREEDTRQMTSG